MSGTNLQVAVTSSSITLTLCTTNPWVMAGIVGVFAAYCFLKNSEMDAQKN